VLPNVRRPRCAHRSHVGGQPCERPAAWKGYCLWHAFWCRDPAKCPSALAARASIAERFARRDDDQATGT